MFRNVSRVISSLQRNGLRSTIRLSIKEINTILWRNAENEISERKKQFQIKELSTDKLTIAIMVTGGLGDALVAANYLSVLFDRYQLNDSQIYIIPDNNATSLKAVFGNNKPSVLILDSKETFEYEQFDIYMAIRRYPEVLYYNINGIKMLHRDFLQYILLLNRFKEQYSHLFTLHPRFDGQSAIISKVQNIKRIQQPDVYGFLGVSEKYTYNVPLLDEKEVLKKFNLEPNCYIAVHRGVDTAYCNNSVKLWPEAYYVEVVNRIKQDHPEYKLIQFGSPNDQIIAANFDSNLTGQTTIEEMKIIVKCCYILIDNEGGTVHLRHALSGGRSIVLFGSTSPDFYGYSENINLYTNACPINCEWVVEKWQDHCLIRGETEPLCMRSLTPEFVIDTINQILNGCE